MQSYYCVLFSFLKFNTFEFVRGTGTAIVPIKLQEGQKMDSKVLRHVTGAGPVYVRMLKDSIEV